MLAVIPITGFIVCAALFVRGIIAVFPVSAMRTIVGARTVTDRSETAMSGSAVSPPARGRHVKLTVGCTTRPFEGLSFAETCERIASAGYTDVAVFPNVGIEPDTPQSRVAEVRRTAEDAGLSPSMLFGYARFDDEDPESGYRHLIDHAATLGSRWILDGGGGETVQLETYVALMKAVAPYAEERGIAISVKPHGGITFSTEDLIGVCRLVNHRSFGVCYDPGNIIYYTKGAERPEHHIREVAPMVTTGIIKDCVLLDGKPEVMITPGEGLVDFEAVLGSLVDGGFDGPLYLECVGGTEIEEISRNVHRTRELVEGVLLPL